MAAVPGPSPNRDFYESPQKADATLMKAVQGGSEVGPLSFSDPSNLCFSNISYRVPAMKGGKVQILHSISGSCRSGRLLALMGASGAGKTSLVDILSGHTRRGVSGKVLFNGKPFQPEEFQKLSCYVLQRDVLLATATVKEAITTSAFLRLPQSMPRAEKKERVLSVLKQLELEKCAHTLVGDDAQGIKGISGGERRRLSVAIGLVTDPQVILLDEPTSGLDSETASQLIHCLVKLAAANRTVVASIHQPNSQITACFDDLLLLSGGRTVYAGTWDGAVPYFDSIGYSCPLYTNPSDYFLTITKDDGDLLTHKWATSTESWMADNPQWGPGAMMAAGALTPRADVEAKPRMDWSPHITKKAAVQRMLQLSGCEDDYIKAGIVHERSTSYIPDSPASTLSSSSSLKDGTPSIQPATSWIFQTRVLVVRFVRSWWRNPILLGSFLAQYLFAGIFLGLMYVQLGTSRSSAIFDRQASLFLVLVMLAFTPANTACTVWDSERMLLRREANSGAYKLSSFFAAKTLVTFPFQAIVTLLFCLLLYFIIGYQQEASKFFVFVVVCVLFQLTSETLGCVSAIITKTSTVGIIVSSTLLMVLIAFSGFLISNTPIFFRWIPKMSYVSFAYSAIYQNELVGLHMDLAANPGLAGLSVSLAGADYECLPTGSSPTSRGPGGNNFTIAQNILILLGIMVGLRVFTLVLLQIAYKTKRL